MLELEYIVSSRTVFSALTTPVSLRSINPLAPLLFALWALSPLGGQAVLKVVEVVPTSQTSLWEFQYLDVVSPMLACSPTPSAGMDAIPPIVGAFNSALASPGSTKNASMDAFGNLKIPMLESCFSNGVQSDRDGWVDASPSSNCSYSSLTGIPAHGAVKANHIFKVETSYAYADCSVSHSTNWARASWKYYLGYSSNGLTFGLTDLGVSNRWRDVPALMNFRSITDQALTNATCVMRQTYVEAECMPGDGLRSQTNPQLHTTTQRNRVAPQWTLTLVLRACRAFLTAS